MSRLSPAQRIQIEPIDERNIGLVRTFHVYLPEGVLEIYRGAVSDGASDPGTVLGLIGLTRFDPRILRASFVHDQLYRTGLVSRKRADEIFYQICIEDGLDCFRAGLLYRVLRAGGWAAYKKSPNTGHTYFIK